MAKIQVSFTDKNKADRHAEELKKSGKNPSVRRKSMGHGKWMWEVSYAVNNFYA